ncbi:MAG: hypothetical protein ABI847_05640 [Anaerolineales bacterium]
MNRPTRPKPPFALLAVLAVAAIIVLAALAFGAVVYVRGRSPAATRTLPAPPTLEPISLSQGVAQVDMCQLIPAATMEAVMGRKLASSPAHFDYYNTPGASGCWYDVGADALQTAHFGYVVLTPLSAYTGQPLKNEAPVTGLGKSAYFNDGTNNARQLWVKIDNENALVVAFGDQPNEAGAKVVAELVLAAVR